VPYADFGDPQSLNQYTYVHNVPTTRSDSDGHCDGTLCDIAKGITGGLYRATELTRKLSEAAYDFATGNQEARVGGDAEAAETGKGNVPEHVFTP
jgi:hypothetical protein